MYGERKMRTGWWDARCAASERILLGKGPSRAMSGGFRILTSEQIAFAGMNLNLLSGSAYW